MNGQWRMPLAAGAAPVEVTAAEPPEPRLFVVYWREGRCRQLFAFRSQVRAASAAEARRGLRLPRGARPPRVFGVKLLCAPGGGCALSGRWAG